MSGLSLVAMAGALLVAGEPPPDASERLARARVCYAALDFDCAERELDEARHAAGALEPEEARELWRLSAEVALSTERSADAEAHLRHLLALWPDFAPDWPESWRAVLEAARRSLPDRAPPVLKVEVPLVAPPGSAVVIEARAEDKSGVGGVTLFVAGEPPRRLVFTTTDGRRWRVTVPAELVVPPALRVWVEAVDQVGNGPATWGTSSLPREIPVRTSEPKADEGKDDSILGAWWFWTAIGLGTAAVATTVGLLVARSGADETDASSGLPHGTLNVGISWESLSD